MMSFLRHLARSRVKTSPARRRRMPAFTCVPRLEALEARLAPVATEARNA